MKDQQINLITKDFDYKKDSADRIIKEDIEKIKRFHSYIRKKGLRWTQQRKNIASLFLKILLF